MIDGLHTTANQICNENTFELPAAAPSLKIMLDKFARMSIKAADILVESWIANIFFFCCPIFF